MTRLLRPIFFLFVLLLSKPAHAVDKLPYRMGIRATLSVPHPTANRAFRRSFGGVYDASVSVNVNVFSNFTLGVTYGNSLWKTPDNKIPGLNTYMQEHLGGLRLGYEYPVKETVSLYGAFSAGRGFVQFTGIVCDSIPPKDRSDISYFQPEFGVSFNAETNLTVGIHISGIFTTYRFSPYDICLNEHKAYLDSDVNGNLTQFNIGFSVTYNFARKKGAGGGS